MMTGTHSCQSGDINASEEGGYTRSGFIEVTEPVKAWVRDGYTSFLVHIYELLRPITKFDGYITSGLMVAYGKFAALPRSVERVRGRDASRMMKILLTGLG